MEWKDEGWNGKLKDGMESNNNIKYIALFTPSITTLQWRRVKCNKEDRW